MNFPFLQGDPQTALVEPHSVVLTQTTARKYFGSENPLGQTLHIDDEDYAVTGVVEDIPASAHFHFDFVAAFGDIAHLTGPDTATNWLNHSYITYLLLEEGTSAAALEARLPAFIERHAGAQARTAGMSMRPRLQALTRIHLHSRLLYELEPNGDIRYVYIFAATACFVLLIACLNFTNLATARAIHRAGEVGLRKVVGAQRPQLVRQFLGESILLAAAGLALALALVEVTLPAFNALTDKAVGLASIPGLWSWAGMAGVVLITGVGAGAYPALHLSGFGPTAVLKRIPCTGRRGVRFRKTLVVGQFAISIFLIIATVAVQRQLDHIRDQRLGFDREQVVVVPLSDLAKSRHATIKETLRQVTGVSNASATSSVPGRMTPNYPIRPAGADSDDITMAYTLFVDHDFVETLGIEMAIGRDFSEQFATDADQAFVLNLAALEQLGLDGIEDRELEFLSVGENTEVEKRGPVIGVVDDFHFRSLHHRIEPLVMHIPRGSYRYDFMALRLAPGDIAGALRRLEVAWHGLFPDHPFEYSFLDADLDALYRDEERFAQLAHAFSLLAVFIACLGLFGLAAFTAECRTKEIGIRKVLGASVPDIALLLSREFTGPVLLANVLAWPAAWYAAEYWLQNFAYRAGPGLWVFVLSGVLALAIAWLTVGYQAVKAALADPVETLRYE